MSDVSLLESPATQSRPAFEPKSRQTDTAQAIAMAGTRRLVDSIPNDASGAGWRHYDGAAAQPRTAVTKNKVRLDSHTTTVAPGPAAPSAEQDAALAADIQAATVSQPQAGTTPWDPLTPLTGTPLQRLLDQAVNGRTLEQLKSSPALLAAVRAAFQTEGGRQFAIDANIIDPSLVGDLSLPVTPGGTQQARTLTQAELAADVDATFVPGADLLPGGWTATARVLRAMAQNSPEFRNLMARARALNGDKPLVVDVDPKATQARFDAATGTIWLPTSGSGDPSQAASSIVFYANQGSSLPPMPAADATGQPTDFTEEEAAHLDEMGAQMLSGGFRQDPAAFNAYIDDEMRQPNRGGGSTFIQDLQAIRNANPTWTAEEIRDYYVEQIRLGFADRALARPESLLPFIARTYDTPDKRWQFRMAVKAAHRQQQTELQATRNHHLVFSGLQSDNRTTPLSGDAVGVLSDSALEVMDRYRNAPAVEQGRSKGFNNVLGSAFRSGEGAVYLDEAVRARGLTSVFVGLPPKAANGGQPGDGAGLIEAAGLEAGLKVRMAAEDAVQAMGPEGEAATAQSATDAALRAQSATLAETILASPAVESLVEAIGPAAAEALKARLAEAIYADVSQGKRGAPATRQVLQESLTAGRSAATFAPGSPARTVLDGVSDQASLAVQSFVDHLFGAAPRVSAGQFPLDLGPTPVKTLVDRLIAVPSTMPVAVDPDQPLPDEQRIALRIVDAGSDIDLYANAPELRAGLEADNYTVQADDRELGRMINAYSSSGNGALSPEDLALAMHDKALVIQANGTVTLDPSRYTFNLGSGDGSQRLQANRIAGRLINLDLQKNEGVGDRRINSAELIDSLEGSSYELADGTDEKSLGRALNAYDRHGDGAVDQEDLTRAFTDGVLYITANGEVVVDADRIVGVAEGQAANIGLRIVRADRDGADRDLFVNADELNDCLEAVGYDSKLSQADCEALIARFDPQGRVLISNIGLQQAIEQGVIVLDDDGTVTYNANA
ncbi:MAG: hypothetical protein V4739_06900 [Pseudomonadota bacterium]